MTTKTSFWFKYTVHNHQNKSTRKSVKFLKKRVTYNNKSGILVSCHSINKMYETSILLLFVSKMNLLILSMYYKSTSFSIKFKNITLVISIVSY